MAETKQITLKRFNGTDQDTLHPTTTWDQVEGKPSTFTPTAHSLNSHTDVNASPTDGQVLTWDGAGSIWIAADGGTGGVDKADLQNLYIYGKASVAITKGQAIQFAGTEGDHILIKPAVQAEINAEPTYMIGIAETDAAINDYIYVLVSGRLILDTSAYDAGDILWYDSAGSTAGALTTTEPTGGTAIIQMAAVSVDGVGNGEFVVRANLISREIHEVIGLQDALDAKVNKSGDTITGNLRIDSGSFASLILDRTTTGSGSIVQFENNNGVIGGVGAFGDDGLQFRNTDGTQMVIDASNNVGIGTTSPAYKLDVAGTGQFLSDSTTQRALYLKQAAAGSGNIVQFLDETGANIWELVGRDNQFYIYNNNLSKRSVYINPSNNYIGLNNNTSPSYPLDVSGSANATTLYENGTSLSSKYYLASNPSGYQTAAQVASTVSALVDSAPTTLDTLNELAAALGDDPNFATTITNALAGKMSTSHPANNITSTHLYMANGDGFVWNDTTNVMYVRKDGTDYEVIDSGNIGSQSVNYATSSGSTTGNAATATKLATARNIALTGDVTGSANFDGSGNISITATVADDSHNHTIANVDGLQTALDGKASTSHNHNGTYAYYDHFRSLGTVTLNGGTTTSAIISQIEGWNAFDSYSSMFKGSWSYAGNSDLSDAGRLTELAGTSWLTWTDNSSDSTRGNITALVIAPNTGGSANKVFIYNDQGSGYSPGWREVWTSASDGSGSGLDADLLDNIHASSFLRSDADDTFTNLSGTSLTLGSGVTLRESSDRADLLRITSSTSTWGGIQIENSSLEALASFMTDGGNIGIYDDQQNEWIWLYAENGGHTFYHNGSGAFVINSASSATIGGNTIFNDGYHPNADKLTTARNIALTGAVTGNANFDGSGNISIATTATNDPTLTLSGDVTGSATFTNLGNATLTTTVGDNSHKHNASSLDIPGLWTFRYSTTTTMSDPGSGWFRLNSTTQTSATQAVFDDVDYYGRPFDIAGAELNDGAIISLYAVDSIGANWDGDELIRYYVNLVSDGSGYTLMYLKLIEASADAIDANDTVYVRVTPAPKATSTVAGGLKARLSGTTLYLRNDSSDA